MHDLPAGTVTLLFTDIEGSTRLLQNVGERYASLLEACRSLLRTAFLEFGGHEVDTQGDAFFVTFSRASDAVLAAVASQRALASHAWPDGIEVRVRMGLHTGEPIRTAEGYVGLDVHHAARIMSAGHGGQVLLSQTTCDLVEHVLPEGVALRDLGEHRLKDLQRASHLFQLVIAGLPADFPPLKTLDASPNNLPVQPTPFLGREREIAAALHLLTRQNVRLLTMTGPGGTGKTRLALQVAAEASDHFAHGVFFVNLAPLSDPALVIPTISQVLDVTERGGQPLLEILKTSLREKQMLLLLDNFEQVAQAAPTLAELLAGCPKLKTLVTSRMALHLRAEQEFAVPPLAVPDLKHLPDMATLSQYEAVALFIARAQAVKSDFQVTNASAPAVAEICVRLDGLPLAIELAAARIKLFPPQALLARLGQRLAVLTGGAWDAPARQQTLRDTIAWSYHLLGVQEQRLFQRLSVFVGSCTLEAVEAVYATCGDGVGQVVDGSASLIDKSLLRQTEREGEEPRLVMLETIREYGLECLKTHGEMEFAQQAYAHYYLALVEQAEPEFEHVQRDAWLERVEREYDNVRAVLEWSLEPGPSEERAQRKEMGLLMAGKLREFWIQHGRINEGRALLERMLAKSVGAPTVGRAKALITAADLAFIQGDTAALGSRAQEALALCQHLGDQAGIALCLYSLGFFEAMCGEYVRARSLLEESVAILRGLSNKFRLALSLMALAGHDKALGEYASARASYEEALALFREVGHSTFTAEMLIFLGGLLFEAQWDITTARLLIDEGLTILRARTKDWFNQWILILALSYSAELALNEGGLETAQLQAEEALALSKELSKEREASKYEFAWQLSLIAQVEFARGNYTTARSSYDEVLTIAKEINDRENLPLYLRGLAEVVAMQGELTWAARLLGAAESLLDRADIPSLPPIYRTGHERAVAAIAARLGEQTFASARSEGRGMTLEQILGAPGRIPLSPPIAAKQASTSPAKPTTTYPAGLTAREVEVLRLVAQGLTDAQVAERLVIRPRTANTHLVSIYNKLGVDTRMAATRFALEHHLL